MLSKSKMKRNGDEFMSSFQQMIEASSCDVLLICKEGKIVETHSEILMNVSPVMKEVLQTSDRNYSLYLSKDFKIYMSLEFNEVTVRSFIRSLSQNRKLRVSEENVEELSALIEALGVYGHSYEFSKETRSHSGREEEEDEAIVDAISNLMDEFNVNPEQSDLAEMLMTTLDESFINDFNDSNNDLSMNNSSLECLLSESAEEARANDSKPEEAFPPAPKRRKMRPTRPPKPQVRDCGVDLENLSDKTLKHYYEMFLKNKSSEGVVKTESNIPDCKDKELKVQEKPVSNSTPVKSQKVMEDSQTVRTPLRRKRKLNVNSEFDYTDAQRKIPRNPVAVTMEESSLPAPAVNDNSSFSPSNVKTEESKEVQAVFTKKVKCLMCEECFNTRSKLLQHICVAHYHDRILGLYPFKKGDCSICVEHGRSKPTVIKNRDVHLRHVGQAHELVLDLLPEDFKLVLNQEFNVRKRSLNNSSLIKQEPLEDSNLSLISQDSLQESFLDHQQIEEEEQTQPEQPQFIRNLAFHEENANMFSSRFGEIESVECRLCKPEVIRTITTKAQMLRHLSCDHLGRELLTLYPLPPSGQCNYCPDSPTPEVFNKESFTVHVGVYHEKIRHILPNDLNELIDRLGQNPEAEDLVTLPKKIIPGPSLVLAEENDTTTSSKASLNSTMQEESVEVGEISFNTSVGSEIHFSQPDPDDNMAKFIELSKNVSQENNDSFVTPAFKCKHCSESFEKESDRVKHVQTKHSHTVKVYNCRYCNQQLKGQKAFKLHLLAHKKALVDK